MKMLYVYILAWLVVLAVLVVGIFKYEPQTNGPPPVMSSMSVASVDTIPSLLQLAGWLAHYDMEVISQADSPTWKAAYPDSGSTVDYFIWQAETIVQASGVPPEHAEGSFSLLRVLTLPEQQQSFRVRLAGVDAFGAMGPWSEWGTWPGEEVEW